MYQRYTDYSARKDSELTNLGVDCLIQTCGFQNLKYQCNVK